VKFNTSETVAIASNDKACQDLLDSVVHELNSGRHTSEISTDLVRQNWSRDAAIRFCDAASKICRELKFLPDHRTACAKRGYDSMQGALSWIGFGACAGVMMYLVGNNARQYAAYALLPVLYGVVELVSGFLLWWPHREYQKAMADERQEQGKRKA
jgi:hypothetical protein